MQASAWAVAGDIVKRGEAYGIPSRRVDGHDFFETLGVRPQLGRGFSPDEGAEDSPLVVVLSHGYWQRRFGGRVAEEIVEALGGQGVGACADDQAPPVAGRTRAFLKVREAFGSFARYMWQFTDGRAVQNRWREMVQVPARTPASEAMSRDLKQRGFSFVGPTICYAHMQAVGMVNDHVTDCFRHSECRDLA